MNATAILEALAAAPKEWRVTSVFSDGKVVTLDQPMKAQAEAHADGKRRFLGKTVSPAVTLDSVTVSRIEG